MLPRQRLYLNLERVSRWLGITLSELADAAEIKASTLRSWKRPLKKGESELRGPNLNQLTEKLRLLRSAYPNRQFLNSITASHLLGDVDYFRRTFMPEVARSNDIFTPILRNSLLNSEVNEKIKQDARFFGNKYSGTYIIFRNCHLDKKFIGEFFIMNTQESIGIECFICSDRASIYRGGLYKVPGMAFGLFARPSSNRVACRALALETNDEDGYVRSGVMLRRSSRKSLNAAYRVALVRADLLFNDIPAFEEIKSEIESLFWRNERWKRKDSILSRYEQHPFMSLNHILEGSGESASVALSSNESIDEEGIPTESNPENAHGVDKSDLIEKLRNSLKDDGSLPDGSGGASVSWMASDKNLSV